MKKAFLFYFVGAALTAFAAGAATNLKREEQATAALLFPLVWLLVLLMLIAEFGEKATKKIKGRGKNEKRN
jgi:hypothetical protein